MMSNVNYSCDPRSFKELVQHEHWLQAMNEELETLEENNTWEIMDLPPGKHAIGCKRMYTIKFDLQRESKRNRSRLVILGNMQQFRVDYGKLSPLSPN